MNPRAEQFIHNVRLGESRVQYPEDVVFFCGGLIPQSTEPFSSLRHFIYVNRDVALVGKRVILAENAAKAFDSHVYDDLMQFEKYIASISRIVLLISESPGSIAELGAFSQITEISPKLLVFIHSQFYQQNSFIKDGPVRFLENQNEQSVFEFDWATDKHGTVQVQSVTPLLPAFADAVRSFEHRQNRTEKFSSARVGHQILLTAGIVHLLGCCKLREIREGLKALEFNFSEKQVKQMIFCLRLFGWVKQVKRDTTYFIYSGPIEAFQFRGNMTTRYFDFERERFDILQAYDKNDPRLSVIETTIL